MLHLIYFLVFNFVLFLTGRSFCILIYKFFVNKEFKDNNKIFTVPIYYFYSLLDYFLLEMSLWFLTLVKTTPFF